MSQQLVPIPHPPLFLHPPCSSSSADVPSPRPRVHGRRGLRSNPAAATSSSPRRGSGQPRVVPPGEREEPCNGSRRGGAGQPRVVPPGEPTTGVMPTTDVMPTTGVIPAMCHGRPAELKASIPLLLNSSPAPLNLMPPPHDPPGSGRDAALHGYCGLHLHVQGGATCSGKRKGWDVFLGFRVWRSGSR